MVLRLGLHDIFHVLPRAHLLIAVVSIDTRDRRSRGVLILDKQKVVTSVKISVGRIGLVAVTAVLASALVACGQSEQVDDVDAVSTGEGSTAYPLALDNCGETVTVDARTAAGRIAGPGIDRDPAVARPRPTAWSAPRRGPIPFARIWPTANEKVPRLADNAPTLRGRCSAPIPTSSPRRSAATSRTGRRRRRATGSPRPASRPYLSPTDCENGVSINGGGKRDHTADDGRAVPGDPRARRRSSTCPSAATELVDELRSRTETAAVAGSSKSNVVAWRSGSPTPRARTSPAVCGSANLLATTVGATNVFADLDRRLAGRRLGDASWNAIRMSSCSATCQRNRFPGDRLADKIAFLESDPVTRDARRRAQTSGTSRCTARR